MASTIAKLVAAAAGALAGSAVAKELSKPAGERTWHGTVAGVPYDFRPPTVEKLRRTLWDPDNSELFPPHAFGVGWSINFGRLLAPPPAPATTEPPQVARAGD